MIWESLKVKIRLYSNYLIIMIKVSLEEWLFIKIASPPTKLISTAHRIMSILLSFTLKWWIIWAIVMCLRPQMQKFNHLPQQLFINIGQCLKAIWQRTKTIPQCFKMAKEKKEYQLFMATMMLFSRSKRDFRCIKTGKQM